MGKSPIQHLQDRVLELEQHQGRDRADLMEKIRVLEHRLGLAQDRIAEIEKNPLLVTYDPRPRTFTTDGPLSGGAASSGECMPPAKNKPKSQLKTDRAKKVN